MPLEQAENMAAYTEILEKSFPKIDTEVYDYVKGLLDGGLDDFDSVEDVYEAVGVMLHQADEEKSEEDIMRIIVRLVNVMKDDTAPAQNGPIKILDAPVHLGKLAESVQERSEAHNSIWLTKKEENPTIVNKTKLGKAEALIKKKQEKKNQDDKKATNGVVNEQQQATASQQANRKFDKMDSSSSGNKSLDIRIENFDIAFGNKVLLLGADLLMSQGRRYGLVGRNGIGKSTLLRMISSRELRIQSHITILHVEQEVVGDDTLAVDSVLECDTKRVALLKEEKDITASLNSTSPSGGNSELTVRLNAVYRELEAIEADKAPAKASIILSGLGFTPRMQGMTTKEFSGGWRMRLALARALFSKPDLLLLDEPTNMLDMKAIIWLENYLQKWPTTILVVSHDRSFLNAVSTDTLHLASQKIDYYKGNFEMFVKTREEKRKNQQREYEAQKEYRDNIQVFIDRFRYNANRAAQVQSKLKLLEKLPKLVPIQKESTVVLKFPESEKLSPPILQLDEVTFYYHKDLPIFKKLDVSAAMDSRICIVGENGAGKTTLLKILLGELEPISGIRHVHRNIRIGYFSQHHVDQLELNMNCVEVLQSKYPGRSSEGYRQQLGAFGVTGELALRPVSSLSGGQKSRVAFALMCLGNPNFFILDEPTNHLDMETIEALGEAINKFQGGVMLVSHDERLIRLICKQCWVCRNNGVEVLEGGIDEYKRIVETELEGNY